MSPPLRPADRDRRFRQILIRGRCSARGSARPAKIAQPRIKTALEVSPRARDFAAATDLRRPAGIIHENESRRLPRLRRALDRGDGRTRQARAGRGFNQDRRLCDLPQRHLLHGRGVGRRIAGGLRPRGFRRRRGGRRGRQAAHGRRSRGGDADPQLRLLLRLRGRRAGLLRGGLSARPPDAACRRRRQAARAWAAHRRLRRTHGRRPVAGGRNPEGHAAR